MYPISDFSPYENQVLKPETQVLLWSRSTGYFFTTATNVTGDLVVIAVK